MYVPHLLVYGSTNSINNFLIITAPFLFEAKFFFKVKCPHSSLNQKTKMRYGLILPCSDFN